eukprot:scaffold244920_cov38-Prasinocladus_malaysianus.AAC.1
MHQESRYHLLRRCTIKPGRGTSGSFSEDTLPKLVATVPSATGTIAGAVRVLVARSATYDYSYPHSDWPAWALSL